MMKEQRNYVRNDMDWVLLEEMTVEMDGENLGLELEYVVY
jgi:hypothetical protein